MQFTTPLRTLVPFEMVNLGNLVFTDNNRHFTEKFMELLQQRKNK